MNLPKDVVKRNYYIAFTVAPAMTFLVVLTSHLVPALVQALYIGLLCSSWAFFGFAITCEHMSQTVATYLTEADDDPS